MNMPLTDILTLPAYYDCDLEGSYVTVKWPISGHSFKNHTIENLSCTLAIGVV